MFTINLPPLPQYPILPKDYTAGVKNANANVPTLEQKAISTDNLEKQGKVQQNYTLPEVRKETLSDKESQYIPGVFYHDRLVLKFGGTSYEFPDDPFVKPSREKIVVETDIVNGNEVVDTVTELMGNGDWQLQITGRLQSIDGSFPSQDLQELTRICNLNHIWEVSSRFLNDLGITNIELRGFSPEQPVGEPDTVLYTITAKSSKPNELILTDLGFK